MANSKNIKIPNHIKLMLKDGARQDASRLKQKIKFGRSTDFGGDISAIVLRAYKMGLEHQKDGFPEPDFLSQIEEIPRSFRLTFFSLCIHKDSTVFVPHNNKKSYAYSKKDLTINGEGDHNYSTATLEKLMKLGLLEYRYIDGFSGSVVVPSEKGYYLYAEIFYRKLQDHVSGIGSVDKIALNHFIKQDYTPFGELY